MNNEDKMFTIVGFPGSLVLMLASITAPSILGKVILLFTGWVLMSGILYKVSKNFKILDKREGEHNDP